MGLHGAATTTAFESKTFALSADGTSIAGSDAGITLTNPGANPTITIPTTKRLKLGFFNTRIASGNTNIGLSDGVIQNVAGSAATGGGQTNCISVLSAGNGWTGLISAISATSFDITFTQINAGLAIAGQAHLIEI